VLVKDVVHPISGTLQVSLLRQRLAFPGSTRYWEQRYAHGGTSGGGSYGTLAVAKAKFLNNLVHKNNINSVIEFGCRDGHQLSFLAVRGGERVAKPRTGAC
jgi:hypothetical protein